MIVFRVCDSRFPFLWDAVAGTRQPPARWHGVGEGPVQYFADTPTGAWAEVLRHEEITDPADLAGFSARIWAVDIGDVEMHEPQLPLDALISKPVGYEACRIEARRLRALGATRLLTLSAALKPGDGAGFQVSTSGLKRAPSRDAKVVVHFGRLPDAEGWCAAQGAPPDVEVLKHVRPLDSA
ncbi:MAG: RES family NAD+ phosphorylase [Proteobacteria bacterium]|nr:RES family NAD+ phosphorylase [Pseudomonadota bacterium]